MMSVVVVFPGLHKQSSMAAPVVANSAKEPPVVERKGSLFLRSDHMKYGRATLNSNWYSNVGFTHDH